MPRKFVLLIVLPVVILTHAQLKAGESDKRAVAINLLRLASSAAIRDDAVAAYVCQETISLAREVSKADTTAAMRASLRELGNMSNGITLESCFNRATQIPDENMRNNLEIQLAYLILDSDVNKGPLLLAEADAAVQSQLRTKYLRRLIALHRLQKAREQLSLMARNETFPFAAAIELVRAYPSGSPEKRAIFDTAKEAYHSADLLTSGTGPLSPSLDDFGALIVQCWNELPPDDVLDAIDLLLRKARVQEEAGFNFAISLGSRKSDLTFRSTQQFRLFEVLPILRALDSHKYHEYLSSDPQLSVQLSLLPDGLASLDSSYGPKGGRADHAGSALSFNISFSHSIAAAPVNSDNSGLREAEELNKTGKGADAVQRALALPMQSSGGHSPRIDALMSLAFGENDRHEINRSAVQTLTETLGDCEPADRAYYLSLVASGLLRFHRQADAEHVLLNDLADMTSTLQALDTGEGDKTTKDHEVSTRTDKLFWTSVSANRSIAYLEARVDSGKAIEFANSVTDPDVQALLYVDVARALLGKAPLYLLVRARYRDGSSILRSYQLNNGNNAEHAGS
jgi:hypothetical protein